MPSTRSGAKTGTEGIARQQSKRSGGGGSKRKQPSAVEDATSDELKNVSEKSSPPNLEDNEAKHSKSAEESQEGMEEPPAKAPRIDKSPEKASTSDAQSKLQDLLQSYGTFPLSDYGLKESEKATPSTVLAHLLNAMLTSARISHSLAAKTVKRLIEANYQDFETLKKSSWDERVQILTEGGYKRYREKAATQLGELIELIESKYGGDISKLREAAGDDAEEVRNLIKDVKGIGDVGVNIFQDTIQGVWPFMAPYLDPRNIETAKELGIGDNVQSLWKDIGQDPAKMSILCGALTTVRLEKKQDDFKDEDSE